MIITKKIIAAAVSAVVCCSMVTAMPASAASVYQDYTSKVWVQDYGSENCVSAQAMAVGSGYVYVVKTYDPKKSIDRAVIYKCNKKTGKTVNLKYGSSYYIDNLLGHANDMVLHVENDIKYLYIGTGDGRLVKMRINDSSNSLSLIKVYNIKKKSNSSMLEFSGVSVYSTSGDTLNMLFKKGDQLFVGQIDMYDLSGSADIKVSHVCTLQMDNVNINGTTYNFNKKDPNEDRYYDYQGIHYYKGNLYSAISSKKKAKSYIIVHNISSLVDAQLMTMSSKNSGKTASYSQKIFFNLSDKAGYSLFEIECCGISSKDGELYFNTNNRYSSSNHDHDRVYKVNNFNANS